MWRPATLSQISVDATQIKDMKIALGPLGQEAIGNLTNLGFSVNQANYILVQNVLASRHPAEKLNHQFDTLKSLGFKVEEIKQAVLKEPGLLTFDPKTIKKNLTNLLKELGSYHGQVTAIQSPKTLLDNVLITNEKIDYCIMEMGLRKEDIAKSAILQYSSKLIRTRHSFAYRSGYYKKIDPKNQESSPSDSSNRYFSELLALDDEAFVKRMKGLTMEDYFIFESMIDQQVFEDNDEEESPISGTTEEAEEEGTGSAGYNKTKNTLRKLSKK